MRLKPYTCKKYQMYLYNDLVVVLVGLKPERTTARDVIAGVSSARFSFPRSIFIYVHVNLFIMYIYAC